MKSFKPENITDIFFDLDHTLWDFEKNSAMAFQMIIHDSFPEIEVDDFINRYVPINREYWLRYQNNLISQADLRLGRLRSTFETFGIRPGNSELERLSEQYITLLPNNNHLFEGAKEVLAYLNDQYRLHIITNGFSQVQSKKLENSGIASYFQTVTDSENAGYKKPDSRIFEFAIQQARTQFSSSLMIGDCIDADVKGALSCGMDAIWFAPDITDDATSTLKISNLIQLKNYL